MQDRLKEGEFIVTHAIFDEWVKNDDPRADIDIRRFYARKVQQNGTVGTCTPLQEPPTSR